MIAEGAGVPPKEERERLRERYLQERDKRIRPEGTGQYVTLDPFSEYLRDPFTPHVERDAVTREVDVLIVGGGFGGLTAGALLRKAGQMDIAIIEDAGDFGGVWYWNRYPGARCDIESYIYLPLLEDLGYMPTERYTRTDEIWDYARRMGRHFDLYKDALFHTRVTELRWEEDRERWTVTSDRGDAISAQFVVLASGLMFSRPKLPGIPGIEGFEGHSFHTSRWDYEYTGGDNTGGLEGLRDKRVAMVGTGASAVQVVPHIAESAKELFVFQRTPSIIDSRGNGATDANWWASLTEGWQADRQMNFDLVLEGKSLDRVLIQDQWKHIWGRPDARSMSPEATAQTMEALDYQQMERIRRRIADIVHDEKTAESLMPYYGRFCKRPCFSDDYLPAFNRPNVTLIDTEGQGPERISEHAVHSGGTAYEVDCIIYATGFESFAKSPSQAGRYNVIGRDGVTLDDKWGGESFASLHGLYTNGFPNMFVLGSSRQSAATFNIPYRMFIQANHVIELITELSKSGVTSMEVKREAELRWGELQDSLRGDADITKVMLDCTPGYYNNEGRVGGGDVPVVAAGYPGGTIQFREQIDSWRQRGEFREDFILRSTSGVNGSCDEIEDIFFDTSEVS
ncbi:NAD(P)/FAD-dependent oxidoreductase [Rhodococcus sp. IEGM 248]|nr:NAD(P)/FAD-dependent oxidoreductase [Rhodococcus sp. IEGM 248]